MFILNDQFTLTQCIIFFLIAVISIMLSYLIYRKDPTYSLNILFSVGVGLLGLSYIFSFLSDFYYLYTESNNVLFIQTAFFLAPIAFMFFYFTAMAIYSGVDAIYKKSIILLFIIIFLVNFIVIYFDNGIYYVSNTNTKSTTPFKLTNLLVIAILYLIIYYYFIRSYFVIDDAFVKNNIRYFLIGWFFGGLGLLSIVGSDYIRELDLVGPIFICIGVIIISRSFLSHHQSNTET